MRTVTNFPRAVVETPDMGITLADGCRLSARVWMPEDAAANPVPAILEYLPYRKRDGTAARDALTHPYLAGHGYACLRVDMRGTGDSDGRMTDEYTEQELADAQEVIAWIAARPWCSGRVGMMGISWGGFNGLQVAARAPEALKAVVTLCSSVDRYADDIHYKGGCLLNENLGWGATMWSYSSRPPDPALVGPRWRAMWEDRLRENPFLPSVWLRHQRRDAYWRRGSTCESYGAVRAAVLAVGGWGDAYRNAPAELAARLSSPAKAIIGPWIHKYPHFAVPEPRIGFLQESLRWWDRWLKDIDTGVENDPPLRAYVMDGVPPRASYESRPGVWVATAPDAATPLRLRLAPGGRLEPAADAPAADLDVTVRSPLTCGLAGGEFCAIWLGPDMPGDQRPDDALSACFDGAPLSEDLTILGAPVLRLTLASDKPVAQIAVRLNEVDAAGASTRITYGVLNLTRRRGMAEPTPMRPGRPEEIVLRLDRIGWRVRAGSRLRVAVSSACWPLLWPAPEIAALTLLRGELELPARPCADADEWSFAPPEAAPPRRTRALRAPSHRRTVETNQADGVATLRIEDDFGEEEDAGHGLVAGSCAREVWRIAPDDPLSAEGEATWTQTLSRPGWSVRTLTEARMRSDARTFFLEARIRAWEGDALIHDRELRDAVARDLM